MVQNDSHSGEEPLSMDSQVIFMIMYTEYLESNRRVTLSQANTKRKANGWAVDL